MKIKIDYVNKQGSEAAVKNLLKKQEINIHDTEMKNNQIGKQQNNFRQKLEEKRKKIALNASDMMEQIDMLVIILK